MTLFIAFLLIYHFNLGFFAYVLALIIWIFHIIFQAGLHSD